MGKGFGNAWPRLILVFVTCFSVLSRSGTVAQGDLSPRIHKQGPRPTKASKPVWAESEILVKFRSDVSAQDQQSILAKEGALRLSEMSEIHVAKLKIRKGQSPQDAIERFSSYSEVTYAEPNFIARATVVPNDEYYSDQWGPKRIGAEQAWETSKGDGVLVADVDSGVDYSHQDLAGKVVKGYDFVNDDSDPMDDDGHGTHVAGIIGALTNNTVGVSGLGWNAKILAVKVLDNSGNGYYSDISNGIIYAADHNAKIINLSLGGYSQSATLEDAVSYARGKGSAVIAAAGNDNTSSSFYPASSGALCVAATDDADDKAMFSNWGPGIDIAAPGVAVLSTVPDNGYEYWSGTSMAAPMISGAAAMVAAKYPAKTGDEIARELMEVSTDLGSPGWDEYFGCGRVNAAAAVVTTMNSVEESGYALSYSGTWSDKTNGKASRGSYKSSSSAGASVTFNFRGTSVNWIARKGPFQGIARVSIDGTSLGNVDLYSPSASADVWQAVAFKKSGLVNGAHALKITVTGTKSSDSRGTEVSVDAFDFISVAGGDAMPPTAPSGFTVARVGNSLNLTWKPSSDDVGVVGYKIEKAVGPTGSFTQVGTSATTAFSDSSITPNISYYYRVRAYDVAGNNSVYSNTVNGVLDTVPPKPPANFKVTRLGGSLRLTWDASVDNEGEIRNYIVERALASAGPWTQIGTVTGRAFVDSRLASKTFYYYRVYAVDLQNNVSSASGISPAQSLAFSSVLKQESSSYLSWTGSWPTVRSNSYSGGAAKYTRTNGNAMAIPFRGTSVAWIGTKAPDKGKANVYIDGVLQGTIDQYAAATVYKKTVFSRTGLIDTAHTLKIVATGTKRAGAMDAITEIDAINITSYAPGIDLEQATTAPAWDGSWSTTSSSLYSAGSTKYSVATNAAVTFTFKGTAVFWIGTRNTDRGIARVYLDGVLQGNFDQYAASAVYQQALYKKAGLTNATHALKIVVTGTKRTASTGKVVEVDAFVVR